MSQIKRLLLLPHIKVHNANALSSPFTIGFPAMTAWLGAVHALQRKLNEQGFKALQFLATGVVSHQCELQTHKGIGDYVHSIISTGNPLVPKEKRKKGEPWENFARGSFIEEARCHLDCSLVIEYTGVDKEQEQAVKEKIERILLRMKIAGGDILGFYSPEFYRLAEAERADLVAVTRKLMPGYALIERRDLMIEAMQHGQDAMDALLDYLALHHDCTAKETDDNKHGAVWTTRRKAQGWLVPIATGFQGLTDIGEAKNQRDPDTPHRFAESVVTLGQFKMPHSIQSINDILWTYQADIENNLYLCTQSSVQSTLHSAEDSLSAFFE